MLLLSCDTYNSGNISDLEWRAAVLTLAYHEYGVSPQTRISDLRAPRRIDWFRTMGNEFAVIYSARDQAAFEYERWFGVHNGGEVYNIFLSGIQEHPEKNSTNRKWYLDALNSDSLGMLFSDKPFWNTDRGWKSFLDSHKQTKLGKLEYEVGMHFSLYYMASLQSRGSRPPTRRIEGPEIGLPFALAYDEPFEQFINDQSTLTMLDHSTLVGDKFALISCRRDEERGAYAIAIGRLDGHLMTYRLVGNRIHSIQGKELENYIDLLVNDKIWSLIGPEEFWEYEELMNDLYDSYFNDSMSVEYQTRTLHLDSLFETGYLNRAVQ